jgi:hypothetical protein
MHAKDERAFGLVLALPGGRPGGRVGNGDIRAGVLELELLLKQEAGHLERARALERHGALGGKTSMHLL